METALKLGILTLSDKASRGLREDTSGPAIAEVLAPLNPEIVEKAIIPDEPPPITPNPHSPPAPHPPTPPPAPPVNPARKSRRVLPSFSAAATAASSA